jgi:hypothetical protein
MLLRSSEDSCKMQKSNNLPNAFCLTVEKQKERDTKETEREMINPR